jgi:ABC-type bacteriocin/lantibiotic exporter with double-glycine peptidase domain
MNIFQSFYQEHRSIVIPHISLTLILFPLEILVLSYLSGVIFKNIKDKKYKAFFSLFVIFFVVFLVIQFLHFAEEYFNSLVIPKLDTFVRVKILDHVIEENRELEPYQLGELMHRIAKAPGHVYKHYFNIVHYIVPFVVCGLFFVVYLCWIEWRLGLVFAVIFFAFYIVFYHVYRSMSASSQTRFDQEHELMDHYEDIFSNWESIRQSNTQEDEVQYTKNVSKDYEQNQKQDIDRVNRCKVIFIITLNMFFFIILVCGIFIARRSEFPFWKLIILITAVMLMSRTMTTLLSKSIDSIFHHSSITHFESFLQQTTKPTQQVPDTTATQSPESFDIYFDHVSFKYPSSSNILLNKITLFIPFQQSTLIMGDIGSGKSTILKLLMGAFTPTSGTICIGNLPVVNLSLETRMTLIGYMNQHVYLFNRTLLENIFYGITIPSNYIELLQNLNVPEQILTRLNTRVGRQGRQLSGGERQIILMLRMYFKPCRIALFDEPTANLDQNATRSVMTVLQKIMTKKTVICITHNSSLEHYFDKVYTLTHGNLIENQFKHAKKD